MIKREIDMADLLHGSRPSSERNSTVSAMATISAIKWMRGLTSSGNSVVTRPMIKAAKSA